jgi:AraC-like DNA-binding protein
MNYTEYKPNKSLSEYIQLIWIAESESADDLYPREKILPDGIVEIVFHFADPFVTYNIKGEKMKQPKGFAVSQMKNFIEIESDGIIGFVSVRFYPWGAHHFFDKSLSTFIDDTIDIEFLWPNDFQSILQAMQGIDNDKRVSIIQNFLEIQLKKHKKETLSIDNTIKFIRDTKGEHSIEELCKKLNVHHKKLERGFVNTLGVTPKVFSKTTRFLHLCHHLDEYENLTMTQLAHRLGYYDQAHFIKDFKAFSGITPKEYFQKNNICFAEF